MRVILTILAVLLVTAIAAPVFIFQRSNAGDLSLQIPAPHGKGGVISLDARLFQPEGDGPFPVVVLAHGCSGWHGSNITDWASWFVDHGFAALMIDSFGPRRVEGVCSDPTQARPTPRERAMDAYDPSTI